MTALRRVQEIEYILNNDPKRYWDSPELQRELRDQLAILHGGEEIEGVEAVGETFSVALRDIFLKKVL